MRTAITFLILIGAFTSFSQDTVHLEIQNPRTVPFAKMPPHFYYSSNLAGDSIVYTKYLDIDLVEKAIYVKSGIPDVWVTYYQNGVIREMGKFKNNSGKKKDMTRIKTGAWLYFTPDGKLRETISP